MASRHWQSCWSDQRPELQRRFVVNSSDTETRLYIKLKNIEPPMKNMTPKALLASLALSAVSHADTAIPESTRSFHGSAKRCQALEVQRSNRRNPMDQFLLPAAGCEGAPAPGAVGRGISLTYHASHPHISIRSLMKKTSPIALDHFRELGSIVTEWDEAVTP
jgi:hypothetical protein